jgi:molybdopterin synthase catalytic subunit/molybdopterin converting factor small subunit
MVRIVYFAAARELAGCDQEDLSLAANAEDGLDEQAFKSLLAVQHPRLAPYLSRMRLALNGELRPVALRIKDGDEVCVLPPVAGGSVLAEVREGALSIDEVVDAVRDRTAGGIAIFLGVVRDHADGKDVARLDYEAHVALANREMAQILEQLMQEHAGVRVAALHRVGELDIGDTAVIVAASAPHRGEAFDVCRLAIDRIKATVPIWKKEWAPDGSALWVNL